MVVRLRQAVAEADETLAETRKGAFAEKTRDGASGRKGSQALSATAGWVSGPEVAAEDLPLARAVEKVVGGMQEVLVQTMRERDEELARVDGAERKERGEVESERREHLRRTKAAEVRVVRNLACLRRGKVMCRARAVDVE